MMVIENPEETCLRIALDRLNYTLESFTQLCRYLKNHNCHVRVQGDDVIISCGDKYIIIEAAMDYVKDFASLVRGYTDV